MHKTIWGLILALAALPVMGDDNPLGISYVRTPDAEFIYPDALEFLIPRAVRTFTNSLDFQRRTFGWVPYDRIDVLIADSADYGGAHASPAPHNHLAFDVAPEKHAFETSFGAERFYSDMNHELIHLVQGDMASSQDRFWRKALSGKVMAQPEYPETLLYNYLTVPRFVSPRWYLEGGGSGRRRCSR